MLINITKCIIDHLCLLQYDTILIWIVSLQFINKYLYLFFKFKNHEMNIMYYNAKII